MSAILDYIQQVRRLGLNEKQEKYFDFLIENGVSFNEKIFVPIYENFKVRVSECFRNSIISSFIYDLDYYEGYYLTEGLNLPLEHGFNIDKSKKYSIDFTAQKFDIPVVEWFGVQIPHRILDDLINSEFNGVLTPLQFYYRSHIDK